jgi:putative restriction endonuclease
MFDSTGDPVFTRQELKDSPLSRIVSETGSAGETPHQTLSRELQQLRNAGVLKLSMIAGRTGWLGKCC